MVLTKKEIKQRHFDKVYQQAKTIKCKCGCGEELKNKDKYGRSIEFINGHNGRKYEDPTQYKREWNHRNAESRTIYRRESRHERKGILIKYKGGKCEGVGCTVVYDGKNGCIFDFHHISKKKFGISGNVMEKSLKKLKKEADKCLLLCANCHRPRHSAEY